MIIKYIQTEVESPPVEVTNMLGTFAEWLPQSWQPYWNQLHSIPMLKFAIIVSIGYIVAKIIQFIVIRSASQVTKRTRTKVDDELVAMLKRPIFLTIFFFFLIVATKSLDITATFKNTSVKIILTVLVFMWMTRGFGILKLLLQVLSELRNRYKIIQRKTIPLFSLVGKIALVAIGSYFILLVWNINPTAWLASAGVIGIAVGFAAKDTLSNLFSGFFIIADTPYKVGDFVVLDSNERGMVTNVGIRSTRILTRDDVEITVPNAVIGNAKIKNQSAGRWEKFRIRIKVGVAYGSDASQVCNVLKLIGQNEPNVCKTPEPRVRMRGFGPSSLDFELLCWIEEPVLRGSVTHHLYMSIYQQFNELNIEIPYSKQDVYIKEMPELNQLAQESYTNSEHLTKKK
ncbi:Potassium efflux system KefA protein / Small-conductance mechanosensitive channel [hydrothermal vent metagenome]|uniref:Potassium efflux system KefA protein / Small-conductance mechanosensitive channel n=1 Tax=hydrothermal vent metagenome TaxID=652676 RepID=A0A3B0VYI7_9ZZZZ